jgi:hypothetical protein
VSRFAAGSPGGDVAASPPPTSTSSSSPAIAGCVKSLRKPATQPSATPNPEQLAESARLTDAFGRFTVPLPAGVTMEPARPQLCVAQDSWVAQFTLHSAAGDRAVFLDVHARNGQQPAECARFGGQVRCSQRALPDGTAVRISDTPPQRASEPELVNVDVWRPDGTVVGIMETGSEAAKPIPRILSDDALVAIATAPELKVNLTAAPGTSPAPAEPSDRRAAELTAALAKEFTLPSGMIARKVPQARAEAMAFFVSQGGYKLNADLVDAAGQGNLFINLNPPAGESSLACDNVPNCRLITLPDGRKAALAANADDITLNTVAADGTQVYVSSSSRSARAEGTGARTRPQPSLGADDLIRIASVTGLRW